MINNILNTSQNKLSVAVTAVDAVLAVAAAALDAESSYRKHRSIEGAGVRIDSREGRDPDQQDSGYKLKCFSCGTFGVRVSVTDTPTRLVTWVASG